MQTLTDDMPLTRSLDAADSKVGDETVILHLGSGTYFGLDPVGSRIWEILAERQTPAAIRARMLQEFDVSPEVLEADIRSFLESLLQHGILTPA